MSKYQEAIDAGYTDEQIVEYFKPKVQQAIQSVGEDDTKAFMVDTIGVPQAKLNLFMGNGKAATQDVNVPSEETFVSVPKRIKQYKTLGKSDEEAIKLAKNDYYHSKGMPGIDAGEQFDEHIWKPFKEGIATVGVGYVSLVDDLMSGIGMNNEDVSKNLETTRQELKKREKRYEETYGLDVVREVSKNLPAVVAAVANPTSAAGLAFSEMPLAYAKTRGEGESVGEATASAAIAGILPAALGLAKATNSVISFPSKQKSKILATINEQAKSDMYEVLRYAEEKGIVLTPAQLTDNKTINQLTDLVTRTPAVANRFSKLNDQNKALLMEAYVNLKQTLSPEEVSNAFIKGQVDPFGSQVQATLKEAKKVRSQRTKEAYALFDEIASEIDVPPEAKTEMIGQLKQIKEWGQNTNNPEGVANLVNDAMRRVKGKVEIQPDEEINILASLFKGYEGPQSAFKESTLADLNAISKQLYKQGKDIQDPTMQATWNNARTVINNWITKLSDADTEDLLNIAKQQHIAKEKLYGLKPDFPAIAKATTTAQTDEIVSNLLKGKAARSNAYQLKREFALAGRPEMSQALAKRYIEDAMKTDVKEFNEIGKFEVTDIIKGYSKVDPEIVKLLAGESAAKELRILTKLAKSTDSLDKLISYQPMTGSSPSMMGVAMDFMRGAIQNKLLGDVLSSDKAMKGLLQIWSKTVKPEAKMKVAKDLAKTAGLSEEIFRPKPASEVIGKSMKTVYRTSHTEQGVTKGPLGKGVYYNLEEASAIEQQANTNKKIFEHSINPDDFATMETVASITGKAKVGFSDIKESVIKDLKLRGFKGILNDGELVIFEGSK